MQSQMRAVNIFKDVAPKATYWSRLSGGSANITVINGVGLTEVFMDKQIDMLIQFMFGIPASFSASYPEHVKIFARGCQNDI